MKLGILREEKVPVDKRTPFSPTQCKIIISDFPNLEIYVQSSKHRCFSDKEYISKGISVLDDISFCDILFGIKEVPVSSLIPNKIYLYFSHIIKKQKYNRDLLIKMIELNIKMIDYEVINDNNGKRLLGFGKFAGIIGAYNTFLTYGLKTSLYNLKPAYKCHDQIQMEKQLNKIKLVDERIIVTGKGRVGSGIIEILNKLEIKQVSVEQFLNDIFDEPVYVHLNTMDYNVRKDNRLMAKEDFYNNPHMYESSFMKYANKADIFIAGHYYSTGSPYLFTRQDAKSSDFNLKVIGDISCDINGPVASTIRSSSIENPIYGYNVETEEEDDFLKNDVIAVMAVDNLPCELPKDSSKYFGNKIIEHILPLFTHDENLVLERATICQDGDLTNNFEYLRDFVSKD